MSGTTNCSPSRSDLSASTGKDHQVPTKVVNQEKTQQQTITETPDAGPKVSIEEQLLQLPDGVREATSDEDGNQTDEWHQSIKVDQLALKLQSLSSEWADTKDQVHYQE